MSINTHITAKSRIVDRNGHAMTGNALRGGDSSASVHGRSFSRMTAQETNAKFAQLRTKQGK